jgi:GGDEF domain-containing protein
LASLDRILEHRRSLERALGRDPGADVAAADLSLSGELDDGEVALARAVGREMSRWRRSRRPFTVLRVDVPGLASAASEYGILFRDVARQRVHEVVRGAVRECDTVLPLGAGSVAVVLPETAAAGAQALASRLEAALGRAFMDRLQGREVSPALHLTWCEHPGEGEA